MSLTEPQKPWLSIEDVAAELQVNPNTIRRAIKEKKLQANKIGKGWRITRESLRQYIASSSNMERAARGFPPGLRGPVLSR